uniref:Large ribosomal subunit protein bL31 n=1 Tax=Mycolicibacterium vaccae TaxID=1810 RepID=A0A3G9H037_MYCVA|nr:50S ribosomal protein L31 [Mycolicibacterium vaccae]
MTAVTSVPVHAAASRHGKGDPDPTIEEETMKSGIHPDYVETTVLCGCGASFTTRSTKQSGNITVEVCSQCHPFYTGKQKILDSGGRVARFEKRYGKRKTTADQ